MPLLWRDRVIGWANLSVKDGELKSDFGYVESQPRDRVFKRELEAEMDRMRALLGLEGDFALTLFLLRNLTLTTAVVQLRL